MRFSRSWTLSHCSDCVVGAGPAQTSGMLPRPQAQQAAYRRAEAALASAGEAAQARGHPACACRLALACEAH